MAKIKSIKGRQVFDSRGNPTVEAEVFLENNISATAISPSGASTGTYEAYEKRDKNNKKYLGKSVFKAVYFVNKIISKKILKKNVHNQELIDSILIRLDGTKQKNKLGANAILSVFPLDSFIVSQGGSPALRMEVDDKPEELTETHKEFIEAVKNNSGPQWKVGSISRQNFYEEAKKAYCIVTTTDARPFGCFIITKGVILPDGKVWS